MLNIKKKSKREQEPLRTIRHSNKILNGLGLHGRWKMNQTVINIIQT